MSDEESPQPTGVYKELADRHAEEVVGYEVLQDGVGVLRIDPEELFTVARSVEEKGYVILSLLSAYDRGDDVGVLYSFVKPASTPEEFDEIRLRVEMPKKDEEGNALETKTQSIVDLFAGADWHEREMWDLYGVHFEGHPDLRRMFLPEGWHGHPGLKDYKEPEQFVTMRDGEDIVLQTEEEGSW